MENRQFPCPLPYTFLSEGPIPYSILLLRITINKEECVTWHAFSAFFDMGLGKSGVRENGMMGFQITQLRLALRSII